MSNLSSAMSSISPSGSKMVFKPVRRNSTVKRPLPVAPPIPPFADPHPTPSSYQKKFGIPKARQDCEEASPCAKIATVDGKQKQSLTDISDNKKSKKSLNAINRLHSFEDTGIRPYWHAPIQKYSKQNHECKVNVTDSSVVILNHFDETKINTNASVLQKKKRFPNPPRKKSEETRLLQLLTKYHEESPRLSAAYFIFWKLRSSQKSNYLKFYDQSKPIANNQGCDDGVDLVYPETSSLIYEVQEISLWLSDDGDYATENAFCPSLGR